MATTTERALGELAVKLFAASGEVADEPQARRILRDNRFVADRYRRMAEAVRPAVTVGDLDYMRGWQDCWAMRTLHDRIPGFAIVNPQNTDPFEFNRDILAEYGITTIQAMYAVAHAPHDSATAHPTRSQP